MAKANRQVAVSTVIRTLMLQGYAGAKTGTGERNLEVSTAGFSSALSLAKELKVHRNTIDWVVSDYVRRSRKTNFITSTLELPAPAFIMAFVKLGTSKPTVDLLAKEFARRGVLWGFLETLKVLKRKPEEAEIRLLVKEYTDGATESRETEQKIIELAGGVSRQLAEETSEKISSRRRRLALCCD